MEDKSFCKFYHIKVPTPNLTSISDYKRRVRCTDKQVLAVLRVDHTVHWINVYPVDSAARLLNSYPLNSDLSVG